MFHIFVSYARQDIKFAKEVVQALAGRKVDTWKDWENIPPTTEWEKEILRGIEEADAFLFLISPDSVRSEMCNKEIAHAINNGKRIATLLIRDTDTSRIPAKISKIQWIPCRAGQDDFSQAISKVHTAIHTDFEWLQYHTKLQVKALDWERSQDQSRLLRGRELREAEDKLVAHGSHTDPSPTDLQRSYVSSSSMAERTRRRTLTGVAVSAAIVISLLCVAAILFRNTANRNAIARSTAEAEKSRSEEKAVSVEIGSLATDFLETRPDLSILLSIEALKSSSTVEARNALMNSVLSVPFETKFFNLGNSQEYENPLPVFTVKFCPGGNCILSGGWEFYKFYLWDLNDNSLPPREFIPTEAMLLENAAFSPDGKYMATSGCYALRYPECYESIIYLWDLTNGELVHRLLLPKDINGYEVGDSWETFTLAFSPDGQTLAAGGCDRFEGDSCNGILYLWDAPSGQPIMAPLPFDQTVLDLSFSQDGQRLTLATRNKVIAIDIATQEPRTLVDLDTAAQIVKLVINGDGLLLVENGNLQITDLHSGGTLFELQLNADEPVNRVLVNPNEIMIITNKKILVLNPEDFTVTDQLENVFPGILDGNSFGSGHVSLANVTGTNLITWNSGRTPFSSNTLAGHGGKIIELEFSADTNTLYSVSANGELFAWDLSSGEKGQLNPIFPPDTAAFLADVNTSLNLLALWTDAGIRIINLGTENTICSIGPEDMGGDYVGTPQGLAITGSGEELVFSYETGGIALFDVVTELWNINSCAQETVEEMTGGLMAASPAGNLAAGGHSNFRDAAYYFIWDFGNQTYLVGDEALYQVDRISGIDFSQDGNLLAVGFGDRFEVNTSVHVIESQTGRNLARLAVQQECIPYSNGLSINTNSALIAFACGNDVLLWDTNKFQPLSNTIRISSPIRVLEFNQAGSVLAVGQEDGVISLWNMDTFAAYNLDLTDSALIEYACRVVGRSLTAAEWETYFPGREFSPSCFE